MINQFKKLNRYNITILLLSLSVFSFGLSTIRFFITDTKEYLFLNWNLFLSFIPWIISTIIIIKGINKKSILVFLILSWLLFFPNSPYILTDMFHLKYHSSAPIWFDFVLILSYAWTGLLFGFLSLMDIEILLGKYISNKLIKTVTVVFLFISSFGIYLGRFQRWNSWDIIFKPYNLFIEIFDRFINPTMHIRTWGVTILLGILLNMMYFSFKILNDREVVSR